MESAATQSPEASRASENWLTRLVAAGAVTPVDAAQIERIHQDSKQSLASIALRLGKVSERVLCDAMAEWRGLVRVEAAQIPSQAPADGQVLPSFWLAHELLPLEITETTLSVAVWDASERRPIEALRFATRLRIEEKVAPRATIMAALEMLFASGTAAAGQVTAEFSAADDD